MSRGGQDSEEILEQKRELQVKTGFTLREPDVPWTLVQHSGLLHKADSKAEAALFATRGFAEVLHKHRKSSWVWLKQPTSLLQGLPKHLHFSPTLVACIPGHLQIRL